SAAYVGAAGQEISDVLSTDERDVTPRRALDRGHCGARIDSLLKAAAAQGRPEEPRGICVTCSDRIHHLDHRPAIRPEQLAAVEHRRALLPALQADGCLWRQAGEAVERVLRRA